MRMFHFRWSGLGNGVRWRQSGLPVSVCEPFVCEYESMWQNEHQRAFSVAACDQMEAAEAPTDRRETMNPIGFVLLSPLSSVSQTSAQ